MLVANGHPWSEVLDYTPDQINLFVRVSGKRRAHETALLCATTAVAVGTGMSGKKDAFTKYVRKLMRGHDDSGDAGGEGMATIRDRLRNMLPQKKRET